MRHVVECGSDGATWCMFDQAGLPDDFDDRFARDHLGTSDQLQAQGRFWRTDTGGDGGYIVHVHIDDSPPPETLGDRLGGHDSFAVPSGTLWICGGECASRFPYSGRRRLGGMGGSIHIPGGSYALSVFEAAPSPDSDEDPAGQLGGCAVVPGCFVLLFGTVLVAQGVRRGNIDLAWFLPVVVAWAAWLVALRRLVQLTRAPAARAARLARPDYVVVLRTR